MALLRGWACPHHPVLEGWACPHHPMLEGWACPPPPRVGRVGVSPPPRVGRVGMSLPCGAVGITGDQEACDARVVGVVVDGGRVEGRGSGKTRYLVHKQLTIKPKVGQTEWSIIRAEMIG